MLSRDAKVSATSLPELSPGRPSVTQNNSPVRNLTSADEDVKKILSKLVNERDLSNLRRSEYAKLKTAVNQGKIKRVENAHLALASFSDVKSPIAGSSAPVGVKNAFSRRNNSVIDRKALLPLDSTVHATQDTPVRTDRNTVLSKADVVGIRQLMGDNGIGGLPSFDERMANNYKRGRGGL